MKKNNSLGCRRDIFNELKLSFMEIKDTYKYIKDLSDKGEEVISAGQWLLDNMYIIEKEYKSVKKNMPREYFNNLFIEEIQNKKSPRIFLLAKKMLEETKGRVSEENSIHFILREDERLNMGELWAFPLMIRINIITNIANISEKIKEFYKIKREEKDKIKNNSKEVLLEERIDILITSLRNIDNIDWIRFFNETSMVEKILLKDPSKTYEKMDFKSKDYYRHKIELIARKNQIDEIVIAEKLLFLAKIEKENCKTGYKTHIGYYLIDDGISKLNKLLGNGIKIKNKFSSINFWLINILGTFLIIDIVLILGHLLGAEYNRYQYILAGIMLIIPASEIVVTCINWIVGKKVTIRHIPKIDLKNGIEENQKSIVMVPTIINSVENGKALAEKLEIIYLSNKDDNLYFAVLGDFKDSNEKVNDKDNEINNSIIKEIKKLNNKYSKGENEKFFFFNRERIYNPNEGVFMGRERKRGKIMEFIALLKGDNSSHTFNVISSSIKNIKDAKYIITLDTDTLVTRGVIKKLIGAMCHPLNKAVYKDNRVKRGYGVMQPKISISLESKNKSKFSKLFGGEGGVDGYSIAYSDTYEDLFGEGSFTGKGIIDIDIFYKVLKDEIPENRVLSHDLLEGCYVRSALVTDCEFIDNYPSTYMGSSKRLSRWVRGDWQLIPWLFSSKLSTLSKWKIFDNLRRSLLAPSILIGLGVSLIYLNRGIEVTVIIFLALIVPLVFTVTDFVVTPKNKLIGTIKSIRQIFFIISFIPYQAYNMMVSIFKALFRLFITKNNLLEWQTAEEAERLVKDTLGYYYIKMWSSVFIGGLFIILSFNSSLTFGFLITILSVLWVLSPFIAYKISKSNKEKTIILNNLERKYLREISRRTWAYYEDFVNEENNYLAPDNYQEKPYKGVANRTSPTNIGMGLISNIVAYDLGYISLKKVVERIELILEGMNKLEKYEGHYLNWYDTKTLKALWPRYVSTVDSGNLLGYLWIVKETLNDYKKNELIRKEEIKALEDIYGILNLEFNISEEDLEGLTKEKYVTILRNKLKELIELKNNKEENSEFNYWIKKLENEIENKISDIDCNLYAENRINKIIDNIENIMEDMNFKILYKKERGLFSIGYNLEEDSLGNSYYDLLASEARTASFLSIARNEVETSHWFKLGRAMTNAFRGKTLVSWSGTMFEYFMPNLIMKSYDNTLLDLTYKSVIKAQMTFGKKKKVPWGISESAFYKFDIDKNYQYKAFGIPKIGLKRGLEDELVVSPYSTLMVLPWNKDKCIKNLKLLEEKGALGRYGFIEAIDFTPNRVNKILSEEVIFDSYLENNSNDLKDNYKNDINDENLDLKVSRKGKKVQCYMVHHLGMGFLALDNILNGHIIQKRFHKIPEVKATEILLKEKIPNYITFEREEEFKNQGNKLEREKFSKRVYKGALRENPELLLLSNGTFSTMITLTGSGYSKREDNFLYRWKGDSTSDSSGLFFYIKNLNSNDYWSATYEPCKIEGEDYKVEFSVDKGKFYNGEGSISSEMEIVVSPEDDLDIRKLTLKNNGEKGRSIEITSYMEIILNTFEGDAAHPSFSNLFIETEFDDESETLIGKRRARVKDGEVPYIFHKVVTKESLEGQISYETSRINFIGRNRNLKSPVAMDNDNSLKNTVGIVLDPIMSIRGRVRLETGEEKTIYFITGTTDNREEAINISKEYSSVEKLESSFNMYNKSMQVELRNFGIKSAQGNIYQSLASYILFLNKERKNREKYIKNINRHQKDLWPYGISGDLKIGMVLIKNDKDIDIVKSMIRLHSYLRNKGLKFDLIIYNDEEVTYEQPLQKNILQYINHLSGEDILNKNGGIFLHNKATMGEDIKDFLIGISSLYVDSSNRDILNEINSENDFIIKHKEAEEYNKVNIAHNNIKKIEINEEVKESEYKSFENIENLKKSLDLFNGYGGFDKEDGSYVIILDNYKNTPAPWINVISNDNFGFHISEVGSAHTWCENSRENKITPWSNDWIEDPLGEAIYIKDNESKNYFSITPEPVRDGGAYIICHGFGYSSFEHTTNNIKSKMTTFIPRGEKVKIQRIILENLEDRDRKISLYYYAQLVLGVLNYQTSKYISTYNKGNYIYGENPYSEYFGDLKAYSTILGGEEISFTCDRGEFIGIGGSIQNPNGLKNNKLNERFGSIFDPCLVSKCNITLKRGEKKELIILLGEEKSEESIEKIIEKYSNISKANEELENVKNYWRDFLGNIKVKTKNKSMDYLLNGWLLYQNYSCRYLARTAFYQSGGAYGFRDQLQDSMSLGLINPKITKEQILRSASRQYLEGDVQHWWHPIINSGIRTRFSDDLLWLPYVTSEYIKFTGDYSILNEKATYLEDEPLKTGEDERYTIVNKSNIEGTIYEHCIKAIERSLKFGEHNIPLMGSGDWNDGMSTVGNKGKGESVWLGWFLYKILTDFNHICDYMKDEEKKNKYLEMKEFIRENIEKNAWDGGWYRRAYFDDGTPLGSRENGECQIDSLAQSWSLISEGGKLDREKEAMEAVEKNLVDEDLALIKLLSPPFEKSKEEPGYIKGYVSGVRENGGQYTHAATWVILALTKLNMGDKALKYFDMINPINHTNTELECRRYKLEPYVMAADVYIREPHGGRGGWSWYTGTAGWMYKVGLENILGFKHYKGEGYIIEPCVPKDFNEFEININNEREEYNIKVKRGEEKKIIINEKEIEGNIIPRNLGKANIIVHYI